jgi:hypothetical protein
VLDTNDPPRKRDRRHRDELAAGAQVKVAARSLVVLRKEE